MGSVVEFRGDERSKKQVPVLIKIVHNQIISHRAFKNFKKIVIYTAVGIV